MIPRDYWQFNLADLAKGMISAVTGNAAASIDLPGIGHAIPVSTGRAGLTLLLEAMGLRGGNVGVPLFCCPVVFEAIVNAGCVPVFLDVDPESYCLTAEAVSRGTKLDAIVAVHMFGNMCDMPEILIAANGVPVIEDCAQALGSRFENCAAGTLGNASFFSFRSAKYVSVGEGGALFARDEALRTRLLAALDSESNQTSVRREVVHVFTTFLKSQLRRKPLYGLVGRQIWQRRLRKPATSRTSTKRSVNRIFRSDQRLATARFGELESQIQRQRQIADRLFREMKLSKAVLNCEPSNARYNRYHFPMNCGSKTARDFAADSLLSAGIDTIPYLDDVVAIAAAQFGYRGNCPVSERLASQTLIIPAYHALNDREVQQIVDALTVIAKRVESVPVAVNAPLVSA